MALRVLGGLEQQAEDGRGELEAAGGLARRASEIQYRFDGDGAWRSTGLYPRQSPRTGRNHPATVLPIDPREATPGRHRLDVLLVNLDGAESGPYTFWFDPQRQILAEAKSLLGDPGQKPFAAFWDSGPDIDNATLYFAPLINHRDALREIRYSINDCDLDGTLPFKTWDDLARSPSPTGNAYLHFPKAISYACFQLVFRDGEIMEPRRIVHER